MAEALLVGFAGVDARILENALEKGGHKCCSRSWDETDEDVLSKYEIIFYEVPESQKETIERSVTLRRMCGYREVFLIVVGNHSLNEQLKIAVRSGASAIANVPVEPEKISALVKEATAPPAAKGNIDVNLVNPFIKATTDTFKTMLSVDVERTRMFLKRDHRMFGDMSGVMGLSGDSVGSVILSLPMKLADIIVSTMLGVEAGTLEPGDINDGIGEFINMISGQAKTVLAETEYSFKISLPSVVSGHGHEIAHQRNVPCIVIVFKASGEEFALQISLVPKKQ